LEIGYLYNLMIRLIFKLELHNNTFHIVNKKENHYLLIDYIKTKNNKFGFGEKVLSLIIIKI